MHDLLPHGSMSPQRMLEEPGKALPLNDHKNLILQSLGQLIFLQCHQEPTQRHSQQVLGRVDTAASTQTQSENTCHPLIGEVPFHNPKTCPRKLSGQPGSCLGNQTDFGLTSSPDLWFLSLSSLTLILVSQV